MYMLQEYCRRLGLGTSDDEITELATTLEAMPQSHPLATLLRGSRDARSRDALADALLNPRDRSYTVPQLYDFLERNGLPLGRWYWQAPYLPQCGAIAATPHANRLAAMPEREQHAAAELWRGTMTCHSALVYRSDTTAIDVRLPFDHERWPRYVPHRLPWTQLIQERLPKGAAGVVLNRSHPYHDLVLILDADDMRLFGRIDGHQSIAEIADAVPGTGGRTGRARTLFERLWQYDQVVFDTSRAW